MPGCASPSHSIESTPQNQLKASLQYIEDPSQLSRDEQLRKENSLKISIQEAKGIPDKRSYYCVLLINGEPKRETTVKYKEGICLWGEMFELYDLHEVKRIGFRLLREDKKRIGYAEFEPVPSIQDPKLDEWIKIVLEKPSKERDKDEAAIRIRYTFKKVTILPRKEYKRFTQYLREYSLTLCRKLETLLNVKPKEDFVTSLMNILQYNGKAVSFLNQLIISDVKQTKGDNDKVLFRANSMATKAIEAYMRLVGDTYLETTLQAPISQIINTTKELEVDCTKVQSDFPSLIERQRNLLQAVEEVWSSILNSPKNFPSEIQEVLFAVRETLNDLDSTYILISASVFLRFLCPAVMYPHLFGLMKEYPQTAANRRLTLVAKTLQTLANFSTFQSKEDCMQFLNPFIERERENCKTFLRNISGSRPTDLSETKIRKFQKDIYVGRHIAFLHLQLQEVLMTTKNTTTDQELRRLSTQIQHIDDCLLRYERQMVPNEQENQLRVLSYRSPPTYKRSISERQSRDVLKKRDDLPLRSVDYNRAVGAGSTKEAMVTKDPTPTSYSSKKNAAHDLSTSDNYVLQSALAEQRSGDSGPSNINALNNNIIDPNLNIHSRKTSSRDLSSRYSVENYPDLNNSSPHLHVTSQTHSTSTYTPRFRPLEKSLSTLEDPLPPSRLIQELEWNDQVLSVTRDAENNMKGSNSPLSQIMIRNSPSGYHTLNNYSPSSSPVDHVLLNNYYVINSSNGNNHATTPLQVSSSPLSSSSSSGVMVTRTGSPHDSPINVKQPPKLRHTTPIKHHLYHPPNGQPSPPMTPPLNGKLSPFRANSRGQSYSPEPMVTPNECLRRQMPLRCRSPSSSSSSSPTSPTVRRHDPQLGGRSSGLATPRTNPHCSPCRISYPKSWRNSPTRRKSSGQAESSNRYPEARDDEEKIGLVRDSRSSWNHMLPQEDHMQAILQRLLTMEQEMRQEQDILLQEMNAKDILLAEQERHIVALDTANSQLIRTIASLTATQSGGDEHAKISQASRSKPGDAAADLSLDSCTASDISDEKGSTS